MRKKASLVHLQKKVKGLKATSKLMMNEKIKTVYPQKCIPDHAYEIFHTWNFVECIRNIANIKSNKRLRSDETEELKSVNHCKIFTSKYPWILTSRENDAILVVGDGDFSFSVAVTKVIEEFALEMAQNNKIYHPPHIITTVYDSEIDVAQKYPHALKNIAFLQSHNSKDELPHVHVLFSIDARCLESTGPSGIVNLIKQQNYNIVRILFNFPHTGEGIKDRLFNIKAQQNLLRQFLESSSKLLNMHNASSKEATSIKRRMAIVKKKNHVSNTKYFEDDFTNSPVEIEVHITIRTGDPYDEWNIKSLSPSEHLVYCESFVFEPNIYPGYSHVCTKGSHSSKTNTNNNESEMFLEKPAKTYVFRYINLSNIKDSV